ncbi:DNA alkylation repair protein [Anaerolentibacter hominis]|uniref:DNA alkylation repair protein n=1 Tax=Anaerolentibacter hominis TaxID=3079009 RepID=UPI0031B83C31
MEKAAVPKSWSRETYPLFIESLFALKDEGYLAFQSRLVPGVDNMIGVRIPILRKLAKEIVKGEPKEFLKLAGSTYYEEVMVQGLVIGLLKKEEGFDVIRTCVDEFLPKINNWAVCDSFCAGMKVTKYFKKDMFDYIQELTSAKGEFTVRAGLILLLNYYIEDAYLPFIFKCCDEIGRERYYVQMAAAWLLSMCFIKYPDETLCYLHQNELDAFTYHKTLQKILESYQVSDDTKVMIREMKKQCRMQ